MIVPLWCVSSLAMPDYPAHLASFFLIAGGAQRPSLSHFYAIDWALIPNLGSEITVPVLSAWLSLADATKLFVSVGIALWVIAPALIHRALYGRFGLAPLAGAFFAYNANLMWGFFNYYFAAGLALVLFAGWIASRHWSGVLRVALFAPVTLALYICHLCGAALLFILIASFEATALWRDGERRTEALFVRFLPLIATFVPTAIAYLFFKPQGLSGILEFNLLSTWQDRFEAAINTYFDRPALMLLAAVASVLAIGRLRRVIEFHPLMLPLLGVVLALAAIIPEQAIGGWGLDLRLPPVLGALALAAADVRATPRAQVVIGLGILTIIGFNAAALAGNWRYYDHRFAEFRAAEANIPLGARIFTVLDGDAIGKASDQPYWHMAEFAVMDRGAFTPLLFTTRGQHVVRLRPGLEKIAAVSAQQGSPPDVTELDDLAAGLIDGDKDIRDTFPYLMRFQCHYDQVVLIHLNGHRSPVPDMLALRHAGSFFSIYDVRRRQCPV
jgi:hypothetical protein